MPSVDRQMKNRHHLQLSIATDFAADSGCPEPWLRLIADAGFTHVHWCHQWTGDFVYSRWEIAQAGRWLKEYGLKLLDLHATRGSEKNHASLREYERRSGVDLIKNRIDMTARLGGDAIVLHLATWPADSPHAAGFSERLLRSLEEIEPHARRRGVRIAIENMAKDTFEAIRLLFATFGPDYLGLCYDSGHGNIDGTGLDKLDSVRDRLIAVHLHDNDGSGDQHQIPFMGTVDWQRLSRIVAASSYRKCPNLEVSMKNCGIRGEKAFLKKAREAGERLAGMLHV